MNQIKEERPGSQCASRHDKYVEYRNNCEGILRREFAAKGGVMETGACVLRFLEAVRPEEKE